MNLYVAIYDTHPGDRKQFERLLKREAQSRLASTGDMIYTESFGSEGALLTVPMKYDLFLIDAADEKIGSTGQENLDTAAHLRQKGVSCPIVLYFSEPIPLPDYAENEHLGNVIFARKPQRKEDITRFIQEAGEAKDLKRPRIELRDDHNTLYVTEDEIYCAKTDGIHVNVYLSGGRVVHILTTIPEFSNLLYGFQCFQFVGKDAIVNLNHVVKCEKRMYTLSDGSRLPIPLLVSSKVVKGYENFCSGK